MRCKLLARQAKTKTAWGNYCYVTAGALGISGEAAEAVRSGREELERRGSVPGKERYSAASMQRSWDCEASWAFRMRRKAPSRQGDVEWDNSVGLPRRLFGSRNLHAKGPGDGAKLHPA